MRESIPVKNTLQTDFDEATTKNLGYGAFSTVSRRYKKGDRSRPRIVKEFKEKTDWAKAMFSRETWVLSYLRQHCRQYLLCMEDAFIDKKTGHMVIVTSGNSEREKSMTLTKFISKHGHRITRYLKLRIMFELAKGLRKLHSLGVMHKDIKPDNIMVFIGEDNKIARLQYIDFGLACVDLEKAQQLTFESESEKLECQKTMLECSKTVSGSMVYMCPEIFLEKSTFTFEEMAKRDIWSLGVVFSEIMLDGNLITFNFDEVYDHASYVTYIYSNQVAGVLNVKVLVEKARVEIADSALSAYLTIMEPMLRFDVDERIDAVELSELLYNTIKDKTPRNLRDEVRLLPLNVPVKYTKSNFFNVKGFFKKIKNLALRKK